MPDTTNKLKKGYVFKIGPSPQEIRNGDQEIINGDTVVFPLSSSAPYHEGKNLTNLSVSILRALEGKENIIIIFVNTAALQWHNYRTPQNTDEEAKTLAEKMGEQWVKDFEENLLTPLQEKGVHFIGQIRILDWNSYIQDSRYEFYLSLLNQWLIEDPVFFQKANFLWSKKAGELSKKPSIEASASGESSEKPSIEASSASKEFINQQCKNYSLEEWAVLLIWMQDRLGKIVYPNLTKEHLSLFDYFRKRLDQGCGIPVTASASSSVPLLSYSEDPNACACIQATVETSKAFKEKKKKEGQEKAKREEERRRAQERESMMAEVRKEYQKQQRWASLQQAQYVSETLKVLGQEMNAFVMAVSKGATVDPNEVEKVERLYSVISLFTFGQIPNSTVPKTDVFMTQLTRQDSSSDLETPLLHSPPRVPPSPNVVASFTAQRDELTVFHSPEGVRGHHRRQSVTAVVCTSHGEPGSSSGSLRSSPAHSSGSSPGFLQTTSSTFEEVNQELSSQQASFPPLRL